MTALLLIGDILVCGFLAGLVAWLLIRDDSKKLEEAARLPLLDDEQSWQGNGAPDIIRRKEDDNA